SMDGDPVAALLREIRGHRAGAATVVLYLERPRVLQFLEQEMTGCASLLSGTIAYEDDGEPRPYAGWYGAGGRGSPGGVALSPAHGSGAGGCGASGEGEAREVAQRRSSFGGRAAGGCRPA